MVKVTNSMSEGEFRGRVLAELDNIKGDTSDIKTSVILNTARITKLENRWAYATGIASGIGALAGFLANLFFDRLK